MKLTEEEKKTLQLLIDVVNSKIEDFGTDSEICGFKLFEEETGDFSVTDQDGYNNDEYLKKLSNTKPHNDKELVDECVHYINKQIAENHLWRARSNWSKLHTLVGHIGSEGMIKLYNKIPLESRLLLVSVPTEEEWSHSYDRTQLNKNEPISEIQVICRESVYNSLKRFFKYNENSPQIFELKRKEVYVLRFKNPQWNEFEFSVDFERTVHHFASESWGEHTALRMIIMKSNGECEVIENEQGVRQFPNFYPIHEIYNEYLL